MPFGDVRTDLTTTNQTDFGYTGQREMGPRIARKVAKGTKGMEGEGDLHDVKSGARPGNDSTAMAYDDNGNMTCRVDASTV